MSFTLTASVMRMPAIVFVLVCGGCGAPASEETAGSQPSPTAGVRQTDRTQVLDVLPATDTAARENRIDGETNGIGAANQFADREASSEFSIPRSILTDLASAEAGIRLRALDHWDTKDTKAPLNAVFEAMEDEDEGVRAEAAAIVEQYWVAGEEREKR